jgi:hypothetical protein
MHIIFALFVGKKKLKGKPLVFGNANDVFALSPVGHGISKPTTQLQCEAPFGGYAI